MIPSLDLSLLLLSLAHVPDSQHASGGTGLNDPVQPDPVPFGQKSGQELAMRLLQQRKEEAPSKEEPPIGHDGDARG